ncbi:hypothetical protein, partial [Pedobacter nototheniae]|uniref:hypothetical protein n=1 Tax=Pedobacter nototheniae TaxID=2488994 RepID=UPI001B8C71E8
GAVTGMIPIVGASGTITYVDPKTTSNTLIDKKDISTDGIVLVNGLSGLSSSVLVNAKLSIAPKSITANQIADNTITSDKIAGKSIVTDGIIVVNFGMPGNPVLETTTLTIAKNSITSDKIKVDADAAIGMIPIVGASRTITYVDPKASGTLINKSDINTDGIILVNGVNGLSSSVLAAASLSIAPKSITANQIADNTITSDKIKVDAGAAAGMIPMVGASRTITYVDPKASGTLIDKGDINTDGIILVNDKTGLSSSVLAAAKLSIAPKSITANQIADNTITLDKLKADASNAGMVPVVGASGSIAFAKAAMPKFFYMPSMLLSTDVSGGATKAVDLYAEYIKQFTNIPGVQNSTGNVASIPNIPNVRDLDYFITYFDSEVITVTSVTADGKLNYTVKKAATATSFVNIVFVVK